MTPSTSAVELASAWCRMRTDDPTIATRLVTQDYRLWADTRPGSDDVHGPRALLSSLVDAQQRTPSRVRPTLVAGDGDRVAFTWNAASPDGTVLTGIDVLRRGPDGQVSASWSVLGERADTLVDKPSPAPSPAQTMRSACAAWTHMWNGQVDLVRDLVTDDFRIWFGTTRSADDTLRGPEDMHRYVTAFRSELGTVRFSKNGEFVLDPDTGRAAVLWTVSLPASVRPEGARGQGEVQLGGIDLFAFVGERIDRVWSITGARAHTLANR